jgi:hypothetical protein
MSREKAKKVLRGWDAAIADARKHIERLKGAIAVCEEKKRIGEPWPGSATERPDA